MDRESAKTERKKAWRASEEIQGVRERGREGERETGQGETGERLGGH